MKQMSMAALVVESMVSDIPLIQEDVLLLNITEGGLHLRAHNGAAYFYDPDGDWAMHNGVIPTGCLCRLNDFLVTLQGFSGRLHIYCARRMSMCDDGQARRTRQQLYLAIPGKQARGNWCYRGGAKGGGRANTEAMTRNLVQSAPAPRVALG